MPSSAWPPRLTSSTQPFLGSFAEKGLGAKGYPKYIYYPLLSNFGRIIIFGNGMQMSCSSSLPLPPLSPSIPLFLFLAAKSPKPSFTNNDPTPKPSTPLLRLQSHSYSSRLFLAKIDRQIHTEVLPTGKVISWQAVQPLRDLVYLSLNDRTWTD